MKIEFKNFGNIAKIRKNSVSAVILAAGSSERFGGNKIAYKLDAEPVFIKTLKVFETSPYVSEIILVAKKEELGELPEGVYYVADLIGLTVETDDGEVIGTVSDVINTGANDIYEVKREDKKPLLIPVIDDVVLNVSLEEGKILVHLMEGLLEL